MTKNNDTIKYILSQNGMMLVNFEKCRAIYTITKSDGNKLIYANVGTSSDLKLGTYKSSEHVKTILSIIANAYNLPRFEMPQQDAEWLQVSTRGTGAGASRNDKTRRGGS